MLLYQTHSRFTHMSPYLRVAIELRRWAERIHHTYTEAVKIALILRGYRQIAEPAVAAIMAPCIKLPDRPNREGRRPAKWA